MRTNRKLLFSAFLLFAFVFVQLASPQTAHAACSGIVYVDAASTALTPDGCSWTTAFPTLQDALAVAASGDQIWVADGTYYPDEGGGESDNDRYAMFDIPDGIALYGGFSGGETQLSQRNLNPATNNTILSGEIGTPDIYADNSYHVVHITSILTTTVLDGFTVTRGYANGGGDDDFGGGVYIVDSSSALHLTNLLVTDNRAPSAAGGGMFLSTNDGSPISAPQLSASSFTYNLAARGGGLFSQNSDPVLNEVIFANNQATNGAGGGMNIQTVNDFDPPANLNLRNVIFFKNHGTGGGGMFIGNSTGTLENVTFSRNNSDRRGGGLLVEVSSPTLTNVTFYKNISVDTGDDPKGGGGMTMITSNAVLNNVTFSGNNSQVVGGDAIRALVNSNLVVTNSIFWGNGNDEIASDGSGSINISHSVVQGGIAGTNVITTSPQLCALAKYGGFTQTMAIGPGSSALDAGDNNTCASTDQRDLARPQGGTCDIGAYEFNTASTVTGPANRCAQPRYPDRRR
jgi:hypothetical protein